MRLSGIAALTALIVTSPLAPATAATHHPRLINRHSVMTRAGHHLPHCAAEDGGPKLPCQWIGTKDGNGKGLSYIVRRNERITYIWPHSPVRNHPRRHWITSALSDALAESSLPHAGRDWQRCFIHIDDTTMIRCPNGSHFGS